MSYVKPLPFTFDHQAITNQLSGWLDDPRFDDRVKLELTVNPDSNTPWCVTKAVFDDEKKVFVKTTKPHMGLRGEFDFGEVKRLYQTIVDYLRSRGETVHRVRVIKLDPLSAYPLHRDEDEYRIHIPLQTNEHAVFLTDGVMETMHDLGRAYAYQTTAMHSAINAGMEVRIHLIVDVDRQQSSFGEC